MFVPKATRRIRSHTEQLRHLPNRTPFYYGWVVLGVGAMGMIMTSPGQTYSVSMFIEHFISDLGISRSLVSSLYTVGTLFGGFLLPLIGRMVDRHGVRRMMLLVASLFAVSCLYMGMVQNAPMLLLGFGLIRLLGQGGLFLVSANLINQWWVRRRGTIMGMAGVLTAVLGLGSFPLLIDALIPLLGWRATYVVLGVMVCVLLVPLCWALVRDRPEDHGLEPDGIASQPPLGQAAPLQLEDNWSPPEAMRTSAFWVLALGVASIAMLSTGLMFHVVSIFADNGLPASLAAAVYTPIAITAGTLRLTGGYLMDRLPARLLMAVALGLQVTALLMARSLGGAPAAVAYGITLGATQGLSQSVSGVIWAKYFGRQFLGTIAGYAQTASVLGAALGPLVLGTARDMLGNYDLILLACAALPLALAAALLFVRRPERARGFAS